MALSAKAQAEWDAAVKRNEEEAQKRAEKIRLEHEEQRAKDDEERAWIYDRAAVLCQYGELLRLRLPPWARSMVGNFRRDAEIPNSVNDVTLFMAIESTDVRVCNPEDQVHFLRQCLGMPQLKRKRT